MRNFIFIFVAVLLFAEAQGQGIAGRRITAEIETDYTLKYLAPTRKFANIGGKFRMGYVVSRHWQIYAGVNFNKLMLKEDVYDTAFANYDEFLGEATDAVRVLEYDLTARYFLSGFMKRSYDCIAPDGKYVEMSVIMTTATYKPGELPYLWREPLLPQAKNLRVSFGLGNQQVWWSRVIVNTGALVSVPVYKLSEFSTGNAPYMDWIWQNNVFRCYASIGILF